MSEEVDYLNLEDLLGLVRVLQAGPVRDLGLLEGCVGRPRSSAFGVDAYPDVRSKAAALLHSIARTHPLVDGNKRLAWLSAVVFLDINGWTVELNDNEAFDLVMDVAAHDYEVVDLAPRLRAVPKR
jgi:death-on-curing protein